MIKAVKIGRKNYKVKYKKLLPKDYATIVFSTKTIYLDETQHNEELADSLLHEILHGIWAEARIADRTSEENAVSKLASGLIHIFRDNPGLIEYIESLIKESR